MVKIHFSHFCWRNNLEYWKCTRKQIEKEAPRIRKRYNSRWSYWNYRWCRNQGWSWHPRRQKNNGGMGCSYVRFRSWWYAYGRNIAKGRNCKFEKNYIVYFTCFYYSQFMKTHQPNQFIWEELILLILQQEPQNKIN